MENQRRTRYFSKTCDPEWNTTMVYENVSPEELSTRYLEVTAWNYEGYNRNHTLGGVLLNLAGKKVYVYPFILHILLEYKKIYESQKFNIIFGGCRIPNVFFIQHILANRVIFMGSNYEL